MDVRVGALLRDLRRGLESLCGDRLKGVYLYGSYARGEADAESDVDVLIVLEDLAPYGEEIDRTSRLVSDVSLRYGVSLSRVFASQRDWLLGAESPFLVAVREEAVPIASAEVGGGTFSVTPSGCTRA